VNDERWDRFAREDAEYYVLTDLGRHAGAEGLRKFFETGRAEARRLLDRCRPYLGRRELAIEIGCGVGRVAVPMSSEFDRLIAVDVSPTMLEKLEEHAARDPTAGVIEPMLANTRWDEPDSADFIYSVLVFQHIERFEEIVAYLERVSHALRPGAVAYLQFDTRASTLPYRVRNALPDRLLPLQWRKGIRRIRRSSASLRRLFAENSLDLCAEHGHESDYHAFIVRAQ
jgi:SAM-dependent methyltransferase